MGGVSSTEDALDLRPLDDLLNGRTTLGRTLPWECRFRSLVLGLIVHLIRLHPQPPMYPEPA